MTTALSAPGGVRLRLLIAFFGIGALAVAAAGAGFYVFAQLGAALERITVQHVPSSLASLELSRRVERIGAAAPPLLAVTRKADHDRVSEAIAGDVELLEVSLGGLRRSAVDAATLASLEETVRNVRDNLERLDGLVARRIEIAVAKNTLESRLKSVVVAMQRVIAPGMLVLDSLTTDWQQAGGQDEAEIIETARTIIGYLPVQKARLEISTINDALIRASSASAADLQLIAFPVQRSLEALERLLPQMEERVRQRLAHPLAELNALATGEGSIPQARTDELALIGEGERLIAENAAVSTRLTAAVDALVATAAGGIEGAVADAGAVRRLGGTVLLAVVLLSVVSAFLIVWLYVDRRLITRLTALSNSMLAIASGNLHAPLPEPGTRDEIGRASCRERVSDTV